MSAIYVTNIVSLGSLALVTTFPLFLWFANYNWPQMLPILAMVPLFVFTHRQNIRRIIAHTEPTIATADPPLEFEIGDVRR